ncbi:putative orfan [Tupanvirus soda lake]|uniref:Orfan n=2 Tax=Tupanvirus TaxID=2094720 RepID=A0AC62ADK8_9VIRU|nr:putative orfan [Tupanvirus soda lake]QKU35821.1 putative orfan [Tupanvirus soda lake]
MECKFCSKNIGGYFYCENCGAGVCGSYGCGEWIAGPSPTFCDTCCKIKCSRSGCNEICGLNRYCITCDTQRVTVACHINSYEFNTVGVPGGHVYEDAKSRFETSQ